MYIHFVLRSAAMLCISCVTLFSCTLYVTLLYGICLNEYITIICACTVKMYLKYVTVTQHYSCS